MNTTCVIKIISGYDCLAWGEVRWLVGYCEVNVTLGELFPNEDTGKRKKMFWRRRLLKEKLGMEEWGPLVEAGSHIANNEPLQAKPRNFKLLPLNYGII